MAGEDTGHGSLPRLVSSLTVRWGMKISFLNRHLSNNKHILKIFLPMFIPFIAVVLIIVIVVIYIAKNSSDKDKDKGNKPERTRNY
jgi:hypothetical protein